MTSREKLLEQMEKSIAIATADGPLELKSLIISAEDGRSINWEKVAEFGHRSDLAVAGVLIDLKVLSFHAEGNYELFQRGRSRNQHGSMNPQSHVRAYFRQEEDALAFKEALESRAMSDEEKFYLGTFPIRLARYAE